MTRPSTAPIEGRSLVKGPLEPPLADLTIPALLDGAVERFGDREALVFADSEIRMSYREFKQAVAELAAGLHALGLRKGERTGIWSPNRFEWVLTQFATAELGVILVNINPAYRLAELEYALNKVGCKALIAAKSFKTSKYQEMIQTLVPELAERGDADVGPLKSEKLPELRHVAIMDPEPGPGMISFESIRRMGSDDDRAAVAEIRESLDPDDAINIQFTSGTTGSPKGATLSHRNIVNNARYVTDRIDLTEEDRLAIPVPLYHCFGMVMGVLGCVSKGAAMLFPGEAFEPAGTLDVLESERATAVYGVPTMFGAMLEDLDARERDLSSMRTGIMAGAPCPMNTMRRVNDEMHMSEVTICYGMTETSPVSFQSFTDDPTEKRCETVGRVHPHLEVKIIGEDGETVPVGQKGELCTRGYSVMIGYWGDEEETENSIVDGWMRTGDLATFDEEGFCAIVGRVKDMIIRGGENIYPREIEEFLFGHPKISDVQVFGIPDEKYGEEICAWAIPKSDADLEPEEVRAFCEGQIAHFKIPKYVRIVSEMPMTVTGKPQKFVMREEMISELEGRSG